MIKQVLLFLGCLLLCGIAAGAAEIVRSGVPLPDGSTVQRLSLRNSRIAADFIPELGGKIVSLRTLKEDGSPAKEFLSRSGKEYSRRTGEMAFGDSEFDGADELFPTLGAGEITAGPWAGRKLPSHGELFRTAWTAEIAEETLTLQAEGKILPYVFSRKASLEDNRLILDYRVENRGKEPLPYIYVFHPLFAADARLQAIFPDGADTAAQIAFSGKGWLGENGSIRPLGEITHPESGESLAAVPYRNGRGYYKFFSTPKKKPASAVLRYPDGELTLTFSQEHFAVWVAEGGVGDLHHYAIEPTNSVEETLAKKITAGNAATIAAGGAVTWKIIITLSNVSAK